MIGKRQAAPDLIEPLVGFREWQVHGNRLYSPYQTGEGRFKLEWQARMQASCNLSHSAPDPSCKCGLYAYHQPYKGELYNRNLRRAELDRQLAALRSLSQGINTRDHQEIFKELKVPLTNLAFPSFDKLLDYVESVVGLSDRFFSTHLGDNWAQGVVIGWGRVEVHAEGFRAEHMKVVALEAREDLKPLAEHYQIELIKDLSDTSKFGRSWCN